MPKATQAVVARKEQRGTQVFSCSMRPLSFSQHIVSDASLTNSLVACEGHWIKWESPAGREWQEAPVTKLQATAGLLELDVTHGLSWIQDVLLPTSDLGFLSLLTLGRTVSGESA